MCMGGGLSGIFSVLVRILCSYAFKPAFGNMMVTYAKAFSWFFLLALFLFRYRADRGIFERQLFNVLPLLPPGPVRRRSRAAGYPRPSPVEASAVSFAFPET